MSIKKVFFYLGIYMTLYGCKTKQNVKEKTATKTVLTNNVSKNISKFYETKPNFKTIYIKADIDYKDDRQAQSVTADIKIEKDQRILVSVRFLGFTVAKALITPDQVQYYEKIGSKFFEGDYSSISQWLGTDLDFQKIQNMILGQPFENLNTIKCEQNIVNDIIEWQPKNQTDVQNQYFLSQNPLLLIKQLVSQAQKNRSITIDYRNHQQYQGGTIPKNIDISANQNAKNTTINIEFTKIAFNEEIAFSYSVPSGYEKLEIKQ